jgi:hypothetical protein
MALRSQRALVITSGRGGPKPRERSAIGIERHAFDLGATQIDPDSHHEFS